MRKADGLPLFIGPICAILLYIPTKRRWADGGAAGLDGRQSPGLGLVHHGGALLFPVLALLILIRTIRSLLTVPCLPEVWAYLTLPNGAQEPLTHWENILGRGGNSDVILNYPVVSRQHAALIRQADDTWTAYDLGSKGGVTVNGRPVEGSAPVQYGDVVGIGGGGDRAAPLSGGKGSAPPAAAGHAARVPWLGLVLLTVFQALTALQLTISEGRTPR